MADLKIQLDHQVLNVPNGNVSAAKNNGMNNGTIEMKPKKHKTIYKKWVHHVGTLRVVEFKKQIRMRGEHSPDHACMSDYHIMDVFIWIGRYLAMKGKLPKHMALEECAIKSNQVARQVRAVIAKEVWEQNAEL